LSDGNWVRMMTQVHMNYLIWNAPVRHNPPVLIRTAGDVPEKMRSARAVFVDPDPASGAIALDAADFDRSVPAGDLAWTPVPGLGQGRAGLVALPQGRPATAPPQAPHVEYDVSLPANSGFAVRLRLSPTLDTLGTGSVRIGVSVDQGEVQILASALEPTGEG